MKTLEFDIEKIIKAVGFSPSAAVEPILVWIYTLEYEQAIEANATDDEARLAALKETLSWAIKLKKARR